MDGAFEGAPNEKDVEDCPKGVEGVVAVALDCGGAPPKGLVAGVDDGWPNEKGEDVLPDDCGGWLNGFEDVPKAVAGGVGWSDFAPNVKFVETAGAEEVRLKLFSIFGPKGFALLFEVWQNVKGEGAFAAG